MRASTDYEMGVGVGKHGEDDRRLEKQGASWAQTQKLSAGGGKLGVGWDSRARTQ
jgi:hypothetical protein